MMSLFSNFDLHFSKLCMIMIGYFTIIFLNSISNMNILTEMKNLVMLMLEEFFLSLKIKNFNKMFILFFSSMMMLLMFMNFTSVLPFNFPMTSQMSIILMISLTTWMCYLIFLNSFSMKGFLSHSIPEGTPMYLVWFLFIIEIISNMIRPITLTVRLVANILAGHLLMILLSYLIFKIFLLSPLYMILNLVEMFVAMIQAYIFSTMLTLYFSEVN